MRIDASRTLRFRGISTSRRRFAHNQGWDQSVVDVIYETMRGFESSFDSMSHLMTDSAQGVFTIKGLAKMLSADDQGVVLTRLALLDQYRSSVRAVPIDEGEKFERASTGGMDGMAAVLDRIMLRLSAATGIPVSVLMGRSPAGLNATGESDTRIWYDLIRAQQRRQLLAPLNRLVEMILRSRNGPTGGVVPDTWSINFRSLWQMTDAEAVEVRAKQAEVDRIYVEMGAVTPEKIAEARWVDGEWTTAAPLVDVAMPTEPGAEVAGAETVAEQALNGAQVSSLVEIATLVASGTLPKASGKQIAVAAFPAVASTTIAGIFDPIAEGSIAPPSFASPPPSSAALSVDGSSWSVDVDGETLAIADSVGIALAIFSDLGRVPRDGVRADESNAEIARKVEAIVRAVDTLSLGDRIVAAVGKGIVEEGADAMRATGSRKAFDVNTPAVNAYIRSVRERATKMNATTIDVVKRAAHRAKTDGDVGVIMEAVSSRMAAIERLSAHEARSLINFCRAEAARQAGKTKTWNAVMDSRTRPQHRRLHRETIGARDQFAIGGDRADAPGGFSLPENSVNCRCWLTFGGRGDELTLLDEAIGLEKRTAKLAPTFAEEIEEETERQREAVRAIL